MYNLIKEVCVCVCVCVCPRGGGGVFKASYGELFILMD